MIADNLYSDLQIHLPPFPRRRGNIGRMSFSFEGTIQCAVPLPYEAVLPRRCVGLSLATSLSDLWPHP